MRQLRRNYGDVNLSENIVYKSNGYVVKIIRNYHLKLSGHHDCERT